MRKFEVYPEVPQRTWKYEHFDQNYQNNASRHEGACWDVNIFI